MNKIILIVLVGLLLIGFVSSYICIQPQDSLSVKEFKSSINLLALQEDINKGITEEGLNLKLKYFGSCR